MTFMQKLGYLLCDLGFHKFYPVKVTIDDTQTDTHYKQCERCGGLVLFRNKK
jgi:hypothetical protein